MGGSRQLKDGTNEKKPQEARAAEVFLFGGATQSRTGLDGFAIEKAPRKPYLMRVSKARHYCYAIAMFFESKRMPCNRMKRTFGVAFNQGNGATRSPATVPDFPCFRTRFRTGTLPLRTLFLMHLRRYRVRLRCSEQTMHLILIRLCRVSHIPKAVIDGSCHFLGFIFDRRWYYCFQTR